MCVMVRNANEVSVSPTLKPLALTRKSAAGVWLVLGAFHPCCSEDLHYSSDAEVAAASHPPLPLIGTKQYLSEFCWACS